MVLQIQEVETEAMGIERIPPVQSDAQVYAVSPGVILLQCPREACPPRRYFQVEWVLSLNAKISVKCPAVDWVKLPAGVVAEI